MSNMLFVSNRFLINMFKHKIYYYNNFCAKKSSKNINAKVTLATIFSLVKNK